MKRFFSVFLFLLALNLVGQPCIPCGKMTHFNFKLIKKEGLHVDSSRVKTIGIYVLETEINGRDEKEFSFIRFFDNGRVFFSCVYCSPLDSIEFKNLSNGYYGYYIVKGNLIKIETFEPYPRYYFAYYEVTHGAIISKSTSNRSWYIREKVEPVKTKTKYVFKNVMLNSVPFW